MTYHISILAYDHCYSSGVINILDVLHATNRIWQRRNPEQPPLFKGTVVSPDGQAVSTTSGLMLPVHGRIDPHDTADMIFIPGSDYQNDDLFMALVQKVGQACRPWLTQLQAKGTAITACCSGSFILAECGLLEHQTTTTTWWLARLFRQSYPNPILQIEKLIIDNGQIICGGAAAYLDIGLYIVEKISGHHIAVDCGRVLLIDANRTSQAPYITLQTQVRHSDDLVLQLQSWIRRNLTATYSLKELAQNFNVSQRTLIRRFQQATGQNLTQYVQDMRVETAKRLLEITDLTLEEITPRVGYVDVSSFRRLFKKRTQLTPREYRQRFAAGQTKQL